MVLSAPTFCSPSSTQNLQDTSRARPLAYISVLWNDCPLFPEFALSPSARLRPSATVTGPPASPFPVTRRRPRRTGTRSSTASLGSILRPLEYRLSQDVPSTMPTTRMARKWPSSTRRSLDTSSQKATRWGGLSSSTSTASKGHGRLLVSPATPNPGILAMLTRLE